jgi:hypothetical protein
MALVTALSLEIAVTNHPPANPPAHRALRLDTADS